MSEGPKPHKRAVKLGLSLTLRAYDYSIRLLYLTFVPVNSHQQQTALVTGCAGFIGFHLSQNLLTDGIRVVGIDNLCGNYDARLKEFRRNRLSTHPNFHFYDVDICVYDQLQIVASQYQCDTLFALAARAGVRNNAEEKPIYQQVNYEGTKNIARIAAEFEIPKLIFTSTSSAYSGNPIPFREQQPTNQPISDYSASKISAEEYLASYDCEKTDIAVMRLFTVYGPAGRPDMAYFRFIHAIDHEIPLVIFGDGQQSRDYTYVADVVSALRLAKHSTGYEIYNIGSGQTPISVLQLVEKIEARLGKRAIVQYQPSHPADMQQTQADNSKAKRQLGWTPETDFDQGLEHCLAWYLDNRQLVSTVLENQLLRLK